MPKFIVTAVTMTPDTRRRAGKSFTKVVDSSDPLYCEDYKSYHDEDGLSSIEAMEQAFEGAHFTKHSTVKVIDVRPVS